MPHLNLGRKKNQEYTYISFLSFVCPKERNKEKGSQKQKLRCFWQANAHEHLSKNVNTFCFRADSLKDFVSCLFVTHGGAVFFV